MRKKKEKKQIIDPSSAMSESCTALILYCIDRFERKKTVESLLLDPDPTNLVALSIAVTSSSFINTENEKQLFGFPFQIQSWRIDSSLEIGEKEEKLGMRNILIANERIELHRIYRGKKKKKKKKRQFGWWRVRNVCIPLIWKQNTVKTWIPRQKNY